MRQAAISTLDSGRWVKGPQGRAFAEEFAKFCMREHDDDEEEASSTAAPVASVSPQGSKAEAPSAPISGMGTLQVCIHRAAGLKAMDFNGKSDPYVKVVCGGQSKKTRVIKANLSPEWNENSVHYAAQP